MEGVPERVIVRLDGLRHLEVRQPVTLAFDEAHLHRFDADGRRLDGPTPARSAA
jgi:hypothetical protein